MRSVALAAGGAALTAAPAGFAPGAAGLAAGAAGLAPFVPGLALGPPLAALPETLAGLPVGAAALEVWTPGSRSCAYATGVMSATHSAAKAVLTAFMSGLRDPPPPPPRAHRVRVPWDRACRSAAAPPAA